MRYTLRIEDKNGNSSLYEKEFPWYDSFLSVCRMLKEEYSDRADTSYKVWAISNGGRVIRIA